MTRGRFVYRERKPLQLGQKKTNNAMGKWQRT